MSTPETKTLVEISPQCGADRVVTITLPDDWELLDRLLDEELIYLCGPTEDASIPNGGCQDTAYHTDRAQGWDVFLARYRQLTAPGGMSPSVAEPTPEPGA